VSAPLRAPPGGPVLEAAPWGWLVRVVVPSGLVACSASLGSPDNRQPPSWTMWWWCQQSMARLPMVVGDGQGTTWWASRRNPVAVHSPNRQRPSRRFTTRRIPGDTVREVLPTPTATPDRSCTMTCTRLSHIRRRAVSVARGWLSSSSAVAAGSSSHTAASSTIAATVARSASASAPSCTRESATSPSARRCSSVSGGPSPTDSRAGMARSIPANSRRPSSMGSDPR
jgi:hypothetical protein